MSSTLTKSNNGEQNTNHLLDLFDDCKNENIIKIFKPIISLINTNHGGYSDWYIPSSKELEELKNVEDFIGAQISSNFSYSENNDKININTINDAINTDKVRKLEKTSFFVLIRKK